MVKLSAKIVAELLAKQQFGVGLVVNDQNEAGSRSPS
jgi:hypothetical protein